MAIDLAGIHNVGEFYSHHYLDALLDRDLKGLFAQWRKEGDAAPDRRLEGCATRFFRAKSQALRQPRLEDRYTPSHEIHVDLLEALGYPYSFQVQYLADGSPLPVLSALKRDGREHVWLAETVFAEGDDSPLDQPLLANQFPQVEDEERPEPPEEPWESLIGQVFARDEPPRWLVLFAGRLLYLFDRTKWGRGQYLLFDLDEIFGRRQRDALRVTAALLARDALSPDDGLPLHDTLDENSHKHAYGVSEDLKYGVRRAVELLANEYVWYMRNVRKEKLFGDDALAGKLTREPLTYLYRLLFLFYAEARGAELGLVPMKAEAYRTGYSIEALRDLEQVPLNTPEAQNGYYIDTSLNQLFKLINEGYPVEAFRQLGLEEPGETFDDYGFTVTGLRSPLFSRESTPLLSSAKFRNVVLQEVLQLLSLSREQRGRRSVRGRISYAQLGINQLGAVYEGLLSYSGFFAQESLVEVKPADANANNEMAQTYFVPLSDAERYKKDEFVYEEGVRKTYPRGTFIFRLAGRDREKSASYYTPEVLTRCVVKYSLKELLPGKSADEILSLTICEPAMGSGAFINEALNQLADAYLERKQEEVGEEILPEQYRTERQKVKAYMAQHNAYGVDLNPTATELAQVSIWLNTLYPGMTAPWYEARMAVGNSLIGARRQVYSVEDVKSGTYTDKAPTPVPLGQPRPQGSVYHWLLPDKGMAAFDGDKVIKELAPDEVQAIKDWRKGFTARITAAELKNMQALSDMADALWARYTTERQALLEQTREPVPVWGQLEPEAAGSKRLSIEEKRRALARIQRPTGPFRRLKLAMDYWCALWFWPIPEAGQLPTRRQFLDDLADILKGEESGFERTPQQASYLDKPATPKQTHLADLVPLSVDSLCADRERLGVADKVAKRVRFHHWELVFAEVFVPPDGFGLILGNPPWIKMDFYEKGLLSDFSPIIALRKLTGPRVSRLLPKLMERTGVKEAYLDEASEQVGTRNFLRASVNYPTLSGKSNLYKCFICRSWELGSAHGLVGLLHPEGVYDDPKGGILRREIYPRLKYHFQFSNELKLFPDVGHQAKFSVNVYRAHPEMTVEFGHIVNLFHPTTVDHCFSHDGSGSIPNIRNETDEWELRGHRQRIVQVTQVGLELFAILYDEPDTLPIEARLSAVHSTLTMQVLEKLSKQSPKFRDFGKKVLTTVMFNETIAQRMGIIRRDTQYPQGLDDLILSGPHFYVATPFNKTPNPGCRSHGDYSEVNLHAIPDDYLPRTNYIPACPRQEYEKHIPKFKDQLITHFYRHVNREMVASALERTMIPAIIPPRVAHIYTVFSIVFEDYGTLVDFEAIVSGIPIDFLIKSMGTSHANASVVSLIPVPDSAPLRMNRRSRVLRLNCITNHYRKLWEGLYRSDFNEDSWAKEDTRLGRWCDLTPHWQRSVALRTPLERRQALLELDVLSSLALELTLEELLGIYRAQFPVMQKYERRILFDQRGMQVPVRTIRGELGPNEDHPDFPDMEPPFTPVDREADYREAWAHFEKILEK